jgi:hypothetical protein
VNIDQCGSVCLLVLTMWAIIRTAHGGRRSAQGPIRRRKRRGARSVPIVFSGAERSLRQVNEVTARRRRRHRRCHYDRFYQDLVRDL